MTGSLAGKVLTLALEQPTFFKSAPILYPRKLMALIGDKEEEQDETKKSLQATLLQTLEDIAVESPWMFGFSDVMYSQTKFSGLEAPYSARGWTGKTEVVSAVLSAAEEILSSSDVDLGSKDSRDDKPAEKKTKEDMNGPILYCAPTGKAASVISKRVGSKAFTIHQIIASYKVYKQGKMENPWKFSQVQIVAVDECSMVSTEVFQWLLIDGAKLKKIILLGDHLQLPSVDPGNFMQDLFKPLGKQSMTVTLQTNHRSEGNLIFENATRISKQQMPVFDGSSFRLIIPGSEDLTRLPAEVRRYATKLGHPHLHLQISMKGREGGTSRWKRKTSTGR